jgi:hypothetical protein
VHGIVLYVFTHSLIYFASLGRPFSQLRGGFGTSRVANKSVLYKPEIPRGPLEWPDNDGLRSEIVLSVYRACAQEVVRTRRLSHVKCCFLVERWLPTSPPEATSTAVSHGSG